MLSKLAIILAIGITCTNAQALWIGRAWVGGDDHQDCLNMLEYETKEFQKKHPGEPVICECHAIRWPDCRINGGKNAK